jgi:hypothetical protein
VIFCKIIFCIINWALFFVSVSGSGIQLLLAYGGGGIAIGIWGHGFFEFLWVMGRKFEKPWGAEGLL